MLLAMLMFASCSANEFFGYIGLADRQTDRHADRQTYTQTDRHTDIRYKSVT